MFDDRRLKELEQAQRMVVAQADVQRGLCGLECALLRDRLNSLLDVRQRLVHNKPLLLAAGAAAAGLLVAGRWRGLAKWVPTLLTAFRWFRLLKRS